MPRTCAAILLAAGAGTRYAGPEHKLSARLPRNAAEPALSVIEAALASVLGAAIGPVIVVTGAAPDVVPAHFVDRVTIQHNQHWDEGQITSVRSGLDAATWLGCTTAVIGLADQPFVTASAWRRIAAADGPIAVATYDGRRGNPVKLDADVWSLLPTTGDEGARALMRVRPDLVREVPCTGSPADIDTEEDLRRWQNN
ncbi:MAG: NTP transferase domain-containing protein [Ilumatobacteraceae bacterium]|jgi:CTP:molybdopterin cytidylyltransferase MocA